MDNIIKLSINKDIADWVNNHISVYLKEELEHGFEILDLSTQKPKIKIYNKKLACNSLNIAKNDCIETSNLNGALIFLRLIQSIQHTEQIYG